MRFLFILSAFSSFWLAVCPMVVPCAYGDGTQIKRHYVEKKEDGNTDVSWTLYECSGNRLVYEKGPEVHVTETDERLSTLSWIMKNPQADCAVSAVRQDNFLSITGACKGDTVKEHIELDDAPWFQASSLSLSRFVRSPQKEIRFWTLRPGSYSVYKLKAVKVGRESIQIAGKSIEAVKLQLSATGWRAPFWKSFYWFRADDGAFLKFIGPADASGASWVVITFTGDQTILPYECP